MNSIITCYILILVLINNESSDIQIIIQNLPGSTIASQNSLHNRLLMTFCSFSFDWLANSLFFMLTPDMEWLVLFSLNSSSQRRFW
jgi:hypothetical protein